MKKQNLILIAMLSLSAFCYAQPDSTAIHNAAAGVSEIVMTELGAPTPIKLLVHTVADFIVFWAFQWVRNRKKKK